MGDVLAPRTEKELEAAIAWALSEEAPLDIVGTGTKRSLGRATQSRATLDMSQFSGIELYEPEELVLEAGAATPMSEITSLLEGREQQLAFEPPDYSRLLGSAHAGTLGGMLACNLSGPRRLKAGAARDHVLGMRGVSGRGEAFKAGARVVKNVTGYDLPKLMAGSWGTLAALTAITMKVLPRDETGETLVISGQSASQAVTTMSLAMQSSCEVSGAAYLPEGVAASLGFNSPVTLMRLEGIAPSIAYRLDSLRQLLLSAGSSDIIIEAGSRAAWQAIRDVHPLCDQPDRPLWRISVAPSRGGEVLTAIPGARGFLDWAGGLVWLDLPPADDAGAAQVRSVIGDGHATLFRSSAQLRATVAPFQPQLEALAALTARVKHAFDPKGILNPGRMYSGV